VTLSKLTHRQCWRSRASPRGSSVRVLTFYGHLPQMTLGYKKKYLSRQTECRVTLDQ
jgi:hypothetical protein